MTQLTSPAASSAVSSVATRTGNVVLTGADIGAGAFPALRLASQTISGTATLVTGTQALILADTTSAAFTITLPAAPTAGDLFIIEDVAAQWATHNLTLALNGKNLNGSSSNPVLVTGNAAFGIVYDGTGWHSIIHAPSDANPAMNGSAAPGTGFAYSRRDHVHPTDTTLAPLASPTFTGTVVLPEGNDAAAGTASRRTLGLTGNKAMPGTATLDQIIAGSTAGQQLVWNGSAWVAATPPSNSGVGLNGLLAESMPLESASNSITAVSGTVYVIRVPLPYAVTFTNVVLYIRAAGSGLTSGQNLVAVYNSAGTQIGSTSADQTTPWATAGMKTIGVGTPGSQTGSVYVAFIAVGSTPPNQNGHASVLLMNANLTGANLRAAVPGSNATAQTSLPGSITPSALSTSGAFMTWAGLS